jgi:dipeptidyl aminopeptidase/acylaminoacyl peptidase
MGPENISGRRPSPAVAISPGHTQRTLRAFVIFYLLNNMRQSLVTTVRPAGGEDCLDMSEASLPLTAELVADCARPQSAAISPDGSWVAYPVAAFGTRGHPPTALWVAPCDGSSPPVRLAADLERERMPRWVPDSASLTFWSGGQLHRIAVNAGASNGVSDGKPEALIGWRGAVADHLPLAGGRLTAFIAADEPDAEDARRSAEGDDAIVWGERISLHRLRLLDLVRRELRVVDGLADRTGSTSAAGATTDSWPPGRWDRPAASRPR